jgi:hypothetical protein
MGYFRGPKIITDGLVLALDAANTKSYHGTGTVWNDLSGNGNNGTLTNGPTFDSGNNGSIVFDGINDYVDTTNIQFERTNLFTLSAWVKSSNVNNNQIINNENTSYRGYQLAINGNNQVFFMLRNTVSSNFIGARTELSLAANQWYNTTATYDGSSNANGIKIYVNGIIQNVAILGNNLSQTTISNVTTYIGIRRPSTPGPFNGKISQVSVYNRALSAEEVQQNFNATKSRYGL